MSEDSLGVRMFEDLAAQDLARLADNDLANDAVAVQGVLSALDDAWQTSLGPATACDERVGDCGLIATYETLRKRYTVLPKLDARYHCTPPKPITRPAVTTPARPLTDLQAYLLRYYNDTVGDPARIDSVEIASFFREEFILPALLSGRIVMAGKGAYDAASGAFRAPFLASSWVGADEKARRDIFEAWKTQPAHPADFSQLSFEQADALLTATAGTSNPMAQGAATLWSKTIHVGDLGATVGENSANTTRFARRFASEISPVGSESIVIVPQRESATGSGDAEPLGKLALRFESINWTEASDLTNIGADPATFRGPSRVIVVPINYAGAKPPTPEDQARWAAANGVTGDPARFFLIVQPRRTHQRNPYFDVSCELPANREYMIYVEAGARADPKNPDVLHPTDPYDNFDVTFTSDTFMIAPDVSKAVAETLVLGGDFARVTTRLPDGRVIPNGQVANTSNSAADRFPRLLGRAYAKYHPAVADPAASGAEASRTFKVTPGKRYIFSVYVSGIDGSDRIVIANGDQPVTISYDKDTVIYQGPNVYEREFFALSPYASSSPQTSSGASGYGSYYGYSRRTGYSRSVRAVDGGAHYRRVSHLSGTDVTLSSAVIKSPYEVVVKSGNPCDATAPAWTKYVAEVGDQGTWYVSEWQKTGEKDPFTFVKRDRMEDEFDARQVIESYQLGPIKRIAVPFTASTDRVTIRFESADFDELRFDRIRVEEMIQ